MAYNKRSSKGIRISKRVLVLCEGESEKVYVLGYRSDDINRRRLANVDVEVYQPTNYSPFGLLKEAERKVKEAKKDGFPYDRVWIVFDKDNHRHIPKTFSEADGLKISIAFSSISFETWILLHFAKTARCFQSANEIIRYIEHKYGFALTKRNYFKSLTEAQKSGALANAKWLKSQNNQDICSGKPVYECCAFTNFDDLIKYLSTLNQ